MPEPIQRTILERFDVPDSNYETVICLSKLDAGEYRPPHDIRLRCAYLLAGDLW